MLNTFSAAPGVLLQEATVEATSDKYLSYSTAHIGRGTYCWNTTVDNGIEREYKFGKLNSNYQVGQFNCIAEGLKVILGRNHNLKSVETGALTLMLNATGHNIEHPAAEFNQKSTVVIQNDVWIGGNVTIMAGVTVHNGAVIARNSHVVKDVPPYAIVGGNPAHIIGYRYTEDLIDKMLKIRWWNWSMEKLTENIDYFTEDVQGFCDRFYPEAKRQYDAIAKLEKDPLDTYFMFVDYYEDYCSYPYILESFLDMYMQDEDKKLVLFVQDDTVSEKGAISEEVYQNIASIVDDINNSPDIRCKVELMHGSRTKAEQRFYRCHHYIISRTYWAVDFSDIADLYGIEVIAGCDSKIPFVKKRNSVMVKE